jgi:hypothetical protein
MYLFTYPLFRPPSTPPWSATIVYAILCLTSLGALSLATFLRASNGRFPEWAGHFWISFEIVNVFLTTLALYAIGGLPLATPEILVRVVSHSHIMLQAIVDGNSKYHPTMRSHRSVGSLSHGSTLSFDSVMKRNYNLKMYRRCH